MLSSSRRRRNMDDFEAAALPVSSCPVLNEEDFNIYQQGALRFLNGPGCTDMLSQANGFALSNQNVENEVDNAGNACMTTASPAGLTNIISRSSGHPVGSIGTSMELDVSRFLDSKEISEQLWRSRNVLGITNSANPPWLPQGHALQPQPGVVINPQDNTQNLLCDVLDTSQQTSGLYGSLVDRFNMDLGVSGTWNGSDFPARGHAMFPIETVTRSSSKRRKGKSTRPAHETQPKHKIDWKGLRNLLFHLYVEKKHTNSEVAFILSVIHDVHISESTLKKKFTSKEWRKVFQKNLVDGSLPQERNEPVPDFENRLRPASSAPKIEATLRLFKWDAEGLNRTPSLSAGPYVCQYKIFHAIDGFVKGLFGSGHKSWTANVTSFIPPPGETDSSRAWQLIFDTVSGVAIVSDGIIGPKAFYLLELALVRLKTAARKRDPNFLLYFWSICFTLSGIRYHSSRYFCEFIFLRVFLLRLRDEFLRFTRRPKDPLVVLVDSSIGILDSTPGHLRLTLGLGCWKTVDTFASMIGHDHAIVLNMGMHHTKSWKRRFKCHLPEIESRYETLLKSQAAYTVSELETRISLMYDYVYALSKRKNETIPVWIWATELRSLTIDACRLAAEAGDLKFDLTTRAFAFASETLSFYFIETWKDDDKNLHEENHVDSFRYMDEAINILQRGDLECQLRAISCSKQLTVWLKIYCQGNKRVGTKLNQGKLRIHRDKGREVNLEKDRRKELMTRIPDFPIEQTTGYHSRADGQKGVGKNARLRLKLAEKRDRVLAHLPTAGQFKNEQELEQRVSKAMDDKRVAKEKKGRHQRIGYEG